MPINTLLAMIKSMKSKLSQHNSNASHQTPNTPDISLGPKRLGPIWSMFGAENFRSHKLKATTSLSCIFCSLSFQITVLAISVKNMATTKVC